MHEVVEILFTVDHLFVPLQQRKYQLVEEDPFVLEELVKEVMHVVVGYHTGKKTKDPLTCIHFGPDVVLH